MSALLLILVFAHDSILISLEGTASTIVVVLCELVFITAGLTDHKTSMIKGVLGVCA